MEPGVIAGVSAGLKRTHVMKDILISVHAKQCQATSFNPAGAMRCVSHPPGFICCKVITGASLCHLQKEKNIQVFQFFTSSLKQERSISISVGSMLVQGYL